MVNVNDDYNTGGMRDVLVAIRLEKKPVGQRLICPPKSLYSYPLVIARNSPVRRRIVFCEFAM